MRELLAAKADPHSLSPDGLSAVMIAASQGHTHTVSLLLEDAKLDPNLKHGASGGTALHAAAFGNHTLTIKELLRGGAALEAVSFAGDGALHRAAINGAADALKVLLACGAKLDCCNVCGTTPLMLAAMQGQTEAVRVLASRGSALDLRRVGTEAAKAKAKELAEQLEAKANVIAAARATFVATSSDEETAQLLANGWYFKRLLSVAQTQALHLSGETALMDAVRGGHSEVVEVLLKHGARVDIHDESGQDALMLARGLAADGARALAGSACRRR